VDRFLRDHGVAVEVALEFDNIENIKQAVEISAGVALLPEPTVQKEVRAGTLAARPLAGWRMVRPLGIIHRRHHPLSSTAQRFIDLLRQPEARNGPGRAEVHVLTGGTWTQPHSNDSNRGPGGPARGPKKTG
jgi:DNA-binding transcriptional LysR family regulator